MTPKVAFFSSFMQILTGKKIKVLIDVSVIVF